MRRLFTVCFCLLLALTLVACKNSESPHKKRDTKGSSVESLAYTLNDDGNSYSVSGIGSCTDTDIIIPSKYKRSPVTGIDDHAFEDCDSLTSITIPDSVTSIGDWAFSYCDNLTSVHLGENSQLTRIGWFAFRDCSGLTSINIPDSVTFIDEEAFRYCYSLTSINVDVNNQYYKSIDGNLYTKDGKTLMQYAMGKTDTSFTVPNGVTRIATQAFQTSNNLTSVTISKSVTNLGDWVFTSCDNLTTVIFEDNNQLTSLGIQVFYYCTNLTSVIFGKNSQLTNISGYTFLYCDSLTSVAIPKSVTSIDGSAFYSCDSLTSVYYGGSEEDWNKISIDSSNNWNLTGATRYYYSETEPTEEGNFWHYVDGEIVVW